MMRIYKFIFAIIFSFIASFSSFAESTKDLISLFPRIIIDVRGSRNGQGDVAAGYLMSADFTERLNYNGVLTLLLDDKGFEIVSRLVGRVIRGGDFLFQNKVQVQSLKAVAAETERYNLYIGLASPSGTFRYSEQLNFSEENRKDRIPLHKEAVLLTQTVLGNTENGSSLNPYAAMQILDETMNLSPAGVADSESGIYWDPVAAKLRNSTAEEVKDFVKISAEVIKSENTKNNLKRILDQEFFKNSSVGLVYGISSKDVHDQFITYLKGIKKLVKKNGKGVVLITPSAFNIEQLKRYPSIKKVIKVYSIEDTLPEILEPDHIAIVKTPSLPHSVFVGLLANSYHQGITPIVAGDGSLSAVVILGIPFVMTRVDWNARNIKNIQSLLLSHRDKIPNLKNAIYHCFNSTDPKLHLAQSLIKGKKAFESVLSDIPYLSHRIILAAARGKDLLEGKKGLEETLIGVHDKVLETSIKILFHSEKFTDIQIRHLNPYSFSKYLKEHNSQETYGKIMTYLSSYVVNEPFYKFESIKIKWKLFSNYKEIHEESGTKMLLSLAQEFSDIYKKENWSEKDKLELATILLESEGIAENTRIKIQEPKKWLDHIATVFKGTSIVGLSMLSAYSLVHSNIEMFTISISAALGIFSFSLYHTIYDPNLYGHKNDKSKKILQDLFWREAGLDSLEAMNKMNQIIQDIEEKTCESNLVNDRYFDYSFFLRRKVYL